MKKLITVTVLFVLMLGSFFIPSSAEAVQGKNHVIDKKLSQLKALNHFEAMTQKANGHFKVSWDQQRGIPRFISGVLSDQKVANKQNVLTFLNGYRQLFDLNAGDFHITKVTKDLLGMSHYRLDLRVDKIPVYGSDFIVHVNQNDKVIAMNGQLEPQLANVNWRKKVSLTEQTAINIAKSALDFTPTNKTFTQTPSATLYLYNDHHHWIPAYKVELQFLNPYPGRYFTFVNATNGHIVNRFNAIEDATGTGVGVLGDTKSLNTTLQNGTYYLLDTTKPMTGDIETYTTSNSTSLPGSYMTDTDDNFNSQTEAAAVDAHYYAGIVYDYYKNTFGRNSYDNNGATIKSTVHYSTNYNNAFWNGSQMVYGDGDGTQFIPLSGALDVVGHELTHAVTESTANLNYQDQSGALNESMSDVFGEMIEAYHGSYDWLMGEDVYTPNTPGDALRSLKDPTLYNQPDNMSGYVYTTSDNGGVHTNSGIPNKAFYNIASTIGMTESGNIYYRALTQYLTSTSNFTDARNALLQSATDLYGSGSTEYNAVADGYAAVGIGSSSGGSSNDTYEPNDSLSSAYGPLTSGTTYNSYIYSASDVDYYKINTSFTGTISVSLSNLPGDYDVYLYDSTGNQLASSINSGTANESISYSATSTGTFYIKVVGYNGAYSTSTAYALNVTYPTGTSSTAQWYYETANADTPHPYPNNYDSTMTYTKTGAQKVALHFSQFETENGYDYVYIKDKNDNIISQYTGSQSAFWAIVDGDQISSELVSDYSVTYYGYHIDEVAYYNDAPLLSHQASFVSEDQQPTTYFKDPIH